MSTPRDSAIHDITSARDIGSVWTMTRDGYTARCALLSLGHEWALRVLVDGEPLLSQRCAAVKDLFAIAEEWKERMARRGWRKVTPVLALTTASQDSCLPPAS